MTAAIWRDYDRQALDAQLNLRARTPEHGDFFARWARESGETRARVSCRLDLAYGPAPGERLDFFPAEEADAPLLVFIHGGYWQALDKGDYSHLAPPFTGKGIAYASLNYTLAPAAGIGDMVQQVRRALRWLTQQAPHLGFDRERIVVAGHSAGGHLAVMAGLATGDEEMPELRGIVSISGVYHLEPISLSYHQAVVRLDADTIADASPLLLVRRGLPPLLAAVGADEPEEFRQQQDELIEAWRREGNDAVPLTLPGRHHFSACDALAEAGHDVHARTVRLLLEGRLT